MDKYYGVPRRGEFLNFDQYDFYLTGFRELEFELNNENQISFFSTTSTLNIARKTLN